MAAGTRRVEALTGTGAHSVVRQSRDALDRMAARLQTGRESVEEKIEALLSERVELQRELDTIRAASRRAELGEAMDGVEAIGDSELAVRTIEAKNPGEMRSAAPIEAPLLERRFTAAQTTRSGSIGTTGASACRVNRMPRSSALRVGLMRAARAGPMNRSRWRSPQ